MWNVSSVVKMKNDIHCCIQHIHDGALEALVVCDFLIQFNHFPKYGSVENTLKVNKRTWLDKNQRLVFPPGTVLSIRPQLDFPLFKQNGASSFTFSDLSISWLFSVFFDKMGLTSNDHPWPPSLSIPPFYPYGNPPERKRFSQNLQNGKKKYRYKRSILSLPSPENMPGGERTIIFPSLEKLLESFGMEGRPCLLRAVCEIHEYPLKVGYGLFGEFVTLFFSISESIYAESHMPEYLKAEETGKQGNCTSYFQNCSKSLFKWEKQYEFS